ncbi:cyclic nucleotide-binding domain-containing protein [Desulfonema magnum]|uniref:Cyclic nucleotide-binding domain-containing protein n=1 Tax=Desulfonema magnum TaxID=45655 RepID=A0A975GTT1_9BACT|nr:cyclic nucleotide-binding domain-containing protein [Desulfonema magnum]QTA93312.1 Cyclic nucleotide-binding domain-containing protein [Desulfonema magnum]
MSADVQTLKSLEIFSELAHEDVEEIASLMTPLKIMEGETVMRRGDPAHTFYIVLSGNFMVHFKDDRAITLHNRGDIMGWSTVITPFQYTGTGVALTDSEILSLPGQNFLRLIQGNSVLGDKIMKKINAVVVERMPFVSEIRKESEDN